MTTIYALREVGTIEARYIGHTSKPLAERLTKHKLNAKGNYPPLVSAWINEGIRVEIISLAECEREDASRRERELVQMFHALGHRLTNSHLLPREPA